MRLHHAVANADAGVGAMQAESDVICHHMFLQTKLLFDYTSDPYWKRPQR